MSQATNDPLFHVFGDESANGNIVAYALVIAPAARIGEIEHAVVKARLAHGGTPDAKIHCKELLHGDQRARSPWSHLSGADTFKLLEETMRRARSAGARAWVGYLDRRGAPLKMLFEGERVGEVTEQDITDLHLVLFAYHAAIAPVHAIVAGRSMHAWMDPNKDRLKMLTQRKQLRLSQGFFPPEHHNVRFEPLQVEGQKPTGLELADIVAHCAARALSMRSDKKERYEAVLKQMLPGLSYVEFAVPAGPLFRVEANTTAMAEIKADFSSIKG